MGPALQCPIELNFLPEIDDDEDTGASPTKMIARKRKLELDIDATGMPVLPPVSEVSEMNKDIIRAFLTEHYSMFLESV